MALCGAIAWGLAAAFPGGHLVLPHRTALGVAVLLAGIVLNVAPKRHFRRAGTTVDPMRPRNSTRLVQSGLHRWSRNPMYLGHAVILLGAAILLANALAFAAVPVYVLYVTRFQILPEERALQVRFGQDYRDYRRRVRRWL
ncbi:MAG TPA: isoprenylcysteine carboxylmethyltransferase family protein [Xanthomonadaceae bacterium]|nr:isoprenylcysteine carboxylmethyltransferase family protein [Xanthomonadaceae bacterium]